MVPARKKIQTKTPDRPSSGRRKPGGLRFDRRYLTAGVLVAIIAYLVSLWLFPEWRQSGRLLLVLAVVAVVGAVNFVAIFRQAFEKPSKQEGDSSNTVVEGPQVNIKAPVNAPVITGTFQAPVQIGDQITNIFNQQIGPNDLTQLPLAREWKPPSPPRPSRLMVGRQDDLQAVRKLLTKGKPTTITAAVQGMPGVGKTLLVEHLAVELAREYPGGVLFERLGAGHRSPEQCNPLLNGWGSHAFGGCPLPEGMQLTPPAVHALLEGHGRMLVVLDDLWSLEAIQPLVEALPVEAHLLVTTRSQRLADDLRGEVYDLDVLNDADALNLLQTRARAAEAERPLLEKLARALGNHAQALDIAAGSLLRLGKSHWPAAVQEMETQVQSGTGFGELSLPGDEQKESRVEAALYFSYQDLSQSARQRFRWLGALAPDASFIAQAAYLLWECEAEEAQGQLSAFAERALLGRLIDKNGKERWQQHGLLRAYALALLGREGEQENARQRQARAFSSLMQGADDRQQRYLLRLDYPQLRHAFEWACEHDLGLAQDLAANTAELQAAFSLVKDNLSWAEALEKKARQGKDPASLARALGTLGNALSRAASLPGEARRERLLQARQAYEQALEYRRPETAPLGYATTQNNLGALLGELAPLPGEVRRERLLQAQQAYEQALEHWRPETAPLDYAMTQGNLGLLFLDMSAWPEEDRRARLSQALKHTYEAWMIFDQAGHAPYAQRAADTLRNICQASGEQFPALWAELNVGEPPEWLKAGPA